MRVFRFWLGVAWLVLAATPLSARTVFIDPAAGQKLDHPGSYTVKKGDTLWTVAEVFLEKPWLAGVLMSPDAPRVYPGDRVDLFNDNHRLMLQFKHGREVKLSPGTRYPRLDRAIKIIPLDSIRQFLSRPQVVTQEEILEAPYVVATMESRVLASEGDVVYVRGLDEMDVEERYMLVRLGQPYVDPESKETLIYESVYLGEAEMLKPGDPSVLKIITARRGVRDGDRIMPVPEQRYDRDLFPSIPEEMNGAYIIAVINGLSQIGQYQVVVLNKGENDDIERGHVLQVYQGGQWITDKVGGNKEKIFLPSLEAATLLVFQVFTRVSYALVMKASDVIHVGDEVDIAR